MEKMSWGTKLGIGASIYVIGILTFVVFSTTQQINLVSKDYYPKEIEYQKQIDKIKNAKELEENVQIIQENGKLQIQFPGNMHNQVKGEIIFYRPADYQSDIKCAIEIDETGFQELGTDQLLKGMYKIKIDWEHDGIGYYKEEAVYLNK
jgi:hypothetical protein